MEDPLPKFSQVCLPVKVYRQTLNVFLRQMITELTLENPLEQEFRQAEQIYQKLAEFAVEYSMSVFGAVIILIAGYFVSRSISQWVTRFLIRKDIDPTLSQLIGSVSYFSILFCFVVIALGKFGISITPFVAALGAFTLGAGLAIQGIVGNYGAGLSIIFTRPFVVGNTLTVQGFSGVVEEIRLAYTVLLKEDGQKLTIPNREIIGQILENSFEHRLVETILTIEMQADPYLAIDVIKDNIQGLDCVSGDPGPQVGIDDFATTGIRIGVRCWVPTTSYFTSKYQVNQVLYQALLDANIQLSTPQQKIHLIT